MPLEIIHELGDRSRSDLQWTPRLLGAAKSAFDLVGDSLPELHDHDHTISVTSETLVANKSRGFNMAFQNGMVEITLARELTLKRPLRNPMFKPAIVHELLHSLHSQLHAIESQEAENSLLAWVVHEGVAMLGGEKILPGDQAGILGYDASGSNKKAIEDGLADLLYGVDHGLDQSREAQAEFMTRDEGPVSHLGYAVGHFIVSKFSEAGDYTLTDLMRLPYVAYREFAEALTPTKP